MDCHSEKGLGLSAKGSVLETAGRIVAKCDQSMVWAMEFVQKIAQEFRFGRPAFEQESGMIFYVFFVKFLYKSIQNDA